MLTTRTSTTKGHKSLGVKSYLWVFPLVIYISKMCYKECTSVIIIPDCHSPKKKKRVYVFLSIFYYDDISQVLQSHDTKHPTEKFSGGKKKLFYGPKPTSTDSTAVDTTCIKSLLANRDQNF